MPPCSLSSVSCNRGAVAAGSITTTACQECSEPVAAAFLVLPGMKYADRIIAGASAKAKEHLQEAIGTAGVHVTAELDAKDAFHTGATE